jgi:hypothetical protein
MDSEVASPIDEFCEQLRSELHAKKLKSQADLDLVRQLLGELEVARQAQLVQSFGEQKGLRVPNSKAPSPTNVAQKLLAAVHAISELQKDDRSPSKPRPAGEVLETLVAPVRELPPALPDERPEERTPWPKLLKRSQEAPVVVVGGSPRPEKLDETLGALAARVEWIETSRHGTHAIGNLAQRIRQRRVSALIVLDAAVGHKHSDPLVSAAREVRIPTTYAHKGGVAALARAFTQLEKMVGAR